MPGNDKDIRIGIKTEADTSGAEEAAESIEDVTKATEDGKDIARSIENDVIKFASIDHRVSDPQIHVDDGETLRVRGNDHDGSVTVNGQTIATVVDGLVTFTGAGVISTSYTGSAYVHVDNQG